MVERQRVGEGEGDKVEKVQDIFIRGIHVECDAQVYTHARMYVRIHVCPYRHCHDVACVGACKKGARNYMLVRAKELAGV